MRCAGHPSGSTEPSSTSPPGMSTTTPRSAHLLLHVRVVIEGVPMHLWSVEGAEDILGRKVRVDRLDSRTLERGHTKTFACWVWTDDVGNIPTKHCLGILPRGAGRVEEMIGFSLPDRRVAPPPATAEYSMLIHVDRVEDWTPPVPPFLPLRAERSPIL
ncbi:D-3-phosphoglycerate dehydrogenase, chloroplastic [Hordeum vulgare]|nr:D-3-phosphoglycerate dehydrogenase, chloroplastic [Hordeum vulgare]